MCPSVLHTQLIKVVPNWRYRFSTVTLWRVHMQTAFKSNTGYWLCLLFSVSWRTDTTFVPVYRAQCDYNPISKDLTSFPFIITWSLPNVHVYFHHKTQIHATIVQTVHTFGLFVSFRLSQFLHYLFPFFLLLTFIHWFILSLSLILLISIPDH